MGYGGSKQEAAIAVGMSGDGGIDGIIKEDYLGLDNIYFQAKQYSTTVVGSPQIRDFKGALDSKHANKGKDYKQCFHVSSDPAAGHSPCRHC